MRKALFATLIFFYSCSGDEECQQCTRIIESNERDLAICTGATPLTNDEWTFESSKDLGLFCGDEIAQAIKDGTNLAMQDFQGCEAILRSRVKCE